MSERWLPVVGYKGFYEVSDLGRVRSVSRKVNHRSGVNRQVTGKILALIPDTKNGYPFVSLSKKGEITRVAVHRLVLCAFVGKCPAGHQARHFPDPNPANIRLSNLSWATPKKNQADRVAHGTDLRGEKTPVSKLQDNDVREIRRLAANGVCQRQIARQFSITQPNVGYIVRRDTWKHI